jgi:hypothetical protein
MLGLSCKEDCVHKISSSQPIDTIVTLTCNNSVFISNILEKDQYEQDTCCFCYKCINDKCLSFLNNMIIILSCKHIFHLHCFINYCKSTYIECIKLNNKDKTFDTFVNKCIICRKETSNNLNIFNSYKKLLEYIKYKKHKIIKDLIIL